MEGASGMLAAGRTPAWRGHRGSGSPVPAGARLTHGKWSWGDWGTRVGRGRSDSIPPRLRPLPPLSGGSGMLPAGGGAERGGRGRGCAAPAGRSARSAPLRCCPLPRAAPGSGGAPPRLAPPPGPGPARWKRTRGASGGSRRRGPLWGARGQRERSGTALRAGAAARLGAPGGLLLAQTAAVPHQLPSLSLPHLLQTASPLPPPPPRFPLSDVPPFVFIWLCTFSHSPFLHTPRRRPPVPARDRPPSHPAPWAGAAITLDTSYLGK